MTDIKKEKRWVVWNLEEVNGRTTKVPYSVNGKKASSTDPDTWTTYEKAKAASEFFSGIGVVFTPDQTLLGIDIDHVLDKEVVVSHTESVPAFLDEANTYTEVSPSGTGLHLYLYVEGGLPLTANRSAPFEVYTSGRFFTFTEQSFGKRKKIRSVSKEEALRLLSLIGYPWGKEEVSDTDIISTPSCFTDEELVDRLLTSRNGDKVGRLYEGDMSDYEGDASRADAALLSHLAFWSGRNAAQMERLWLASPLGKREKTQNRKDYRTRSISNAIRNCTQVYTPQPVEVEIDFLYTIGAKGDRLFNKNTENVCRVLRHHPAFKGRLRFDEFKNRIELDHKPFLDSDTIDIQTEVSILFPFLRSVGKDMTYDAIVKVARENRIDSGSDFIRSIAWDKKARLDDWLTHTYGAPSDEYHRAVASNWLKGLVKRIIEPGCKFDYVLVLEGPQGARKSTSLNVLGRINAKENWHVESTMSTDTKDFFMQFEGKAIIEFSEGETLSRTEVKKMKSIITTAWDRYRPSYGRVAEDFPRRCVFAMTTNQDEYLKDETGNRRWLPVRLVFAQADIAWLEANRDQLLAEAYDRVIKRHETTYEFPLEETLKQQESRRISDPNADKIVEWYYENFSNTDRKDGITVESVFHGALGGFGSMKGYEAAAIADVLKRNLGLTRKRRMINGVQQWRWVNENQIPIEELAEQTND